MSKAPVMLISFVLVFGSFLLALDMNAEGKCIPHPEPSADTEFVNLNLMDMYDFDADAYATAWRPDGEYLAVCGDNINGGQDLMVLRLLNNNLYYIDGVDLAAPVRSVSWSPDGNYLATGSENSPVAELFVQSFNGVSLTLIDAYEYGITLYAVDWSPDGTTIAVGGGFSNTWVINFDGSTLIPNCFFFHGDDLRSVHWSPDGLYLAVGGLSSVGVDVLLYTGAALILVDSYLHGDNVISVEWDPTGAYLAFAGFTSGGVEARILEFDGFSLTQVAQYSHGANLYSVSWNQDGRYLAVGGNSGVGGYELRILAFNGTSLAMVDDWDFGDTVWGIDWSPNDDHLAVAGAFIANELQVFEISWGFIPEDDTFTIPEDVTTEVCVLANDADDLGEFSIIAWTNGTNCQVSFSGGNLSVLPNANWTGVDVFTYNVSDGYGRAFTLNVTVTVTNTNDLHTITTANDPDGVVGDIYYVDYDVTDVDPLDTHTWSLSTNASWLWMDSATGELAGVPTQDGIFIVQVTATDGDGNDVTTQFTLTVILDTDGDGLPNTIDIDDDGDGWLDTSDDFPLDPAEWIDTDGDGIGNNADTDDDNDGVPDISDSDPLNPLEPADIDNDGLIGDDDFDDDGDGWTDIIELVAGTDPLDNSSMPSDADGDGIADFMDADFLVTTMYDNSTLYSNNTEFNNNTLYSNSTQYNNETFNSTTGLPDVDSDGDGWMDLVEILAGTDPLDNTDMPSDADGDGQADFMDPDFYQTEAPEPEVVTVTVTPIWAWIALIAVIVMGVLAAIGFLRGGGKTEPVERVPEAEEKVPQPGPQQ